MPTNRESEQEPEEIGKPHAMDSTGAKPGTERARDEQREGGGPRYGGEAWEVADKRGDRRFGEARNDDSDPSELSKGSGDDDDDTWLGDDASPQANEIGKPHGDAERTAAGASESGGQHAGMYRGEKPRKPKARTKPNPRSGKR